MIDPLVSSIPRRRLFSLLFKEFCPRGRQTTTRRPIRCLSLLTGEDATNQQNNKFFDVAIVGGGVVGSSVAHLIQRTMPNLRVALIESREAPVPQPAIRQPQERVPNPRSYALSPSSLKLLG
jgi:hypothetical protein